MRQFFKKVAKCARGFQGEVGRGGGQGELLHNAGATLLTGGVLAPSPPRWAGLGGAGGGGVPGESLSGLWRKGGRTEAVKHHKSNVSNQVAGVKTGDVNPLHLHCFWNSVQRVEPEHLEFPPGLVK